MLYLKNSYSFLKHIIVIPLISTVIIPIVLMDIWMEIYHRICFPLYGMPYIKRSNYITVMDRAKLPYLNILQKLYCMYCGYGNGVLRYWSQIAGETEHYRCGIQHKKQSNSSRAAHQKGFTKYGDKEEFKKRYCK